MPIEILFRYYIIHKHNNKMGGRINLLRGSIFDYLNKSCDIMEILACCYKMFR